MEFVLQSLDQLTPDNYFKVGISERMFHFYLHQKRDGYFLIKENGQRYCVTPKWAIDMHLSLIGRITYVEMDDIILYEKHLEGPNLPLYRMVLIEESNSS